MPSLRALVKNHFPPDRNASVLDLGCGHGAIMHAAREQGYRNLRGVDGSVEQVAAAKQLGIEGVEHGDVLSTLEQCKDASLDVVVAFDVLEHFTKDELLPFIDQVHRVLKPGGRFIIHVPNGESLFGSRMFFWDLTHELAFTRQSLSQLMLSSGYAQVECFEDIPVVHGFKSALRWSIWKVFRGLLRLYIATETGDSGKRAVFSQNMLAVVTR
jgi:2-polyprenyl-3-methyl-5-hydroxy-6-metoxy-1,4-benzoquinol methylase